MRPHSRGPIRPRFSNSFRASRKKEGAGNTGCALHPRSRVQCNKEMRTRAYRAAESIRHSLRNGFTAYSALSPVIGFLATVASEIKSADLTPAPRRQDHTSSPYAIRAFVLRAHRVHRDLSQRLRRWPTPLRVGQDGDRCAPDLPFGKSE